ncbi:hypothetical protein [Halomicrobium salinisoli]|uniref:hypothetical protein n=1 Tax=Halomicrobium salinisoli TaxID=2878391 RepID=UPI001CEFB54E|nr:hypothetical protein [Halomicrobium salinisoli]
MDLPSPDPIHAVRERWVADEGTDAVAWVESAPRWVATGEDRWTYAGTSTGEEYVLTVGAADGTADPDGSPEVTLTRVLPGWVRYLVYGLVGLAVLAALDPSLLSAGALAIGVVYASRYDPSLLARAPLRRASHRVHPAVAGLYLGGMLAMGRYAGTRVPAGGWGIAITALTLAYAASVLYSRNALPFQSATRAAHVLRIPLGVAGSTVLSLGVVFGVTLLAARAAASLADLFDRPAPAAASVGSGLPAGAVETGGSDALVLFMQVIDWFPVAVCVYGLYLGAHVSYAAVADARRVADFLDGARPHAAGSARQRVTLALLYCVWGGLALGCALVAAGVVWFGVAGRWPLPDAVLAPAVATLPQSMDQSAEALLTATFAVFDRTFAVVPVVDPRTGSVLALLVVFAQVALIPLGAAVAAVATPVGHLGRFVRSAPVAVPGRRLPVVRASPSAESIEPVRVLGHTLWLSLPSDVAADLDPDELAALVDAVAAAGTEPPLAVRALAALAVVVPGGRNLGPALVPLVDRTAASADGAAPLDAALAELRDRQAESPSKAGGERTNGTLQAAVGPARRWLDRRVLPALLLYYGSARLDRALPAPLSDGDSPPDERRSIRSSNDG